MLSLLAAQRQVYIVPFPYDTGANMRGASLAPLALKKAGLRGEWMGPAAAERGKMGERAGREERVGIGKGTKITKSLRRGIGRAHASFSEAVGEGIPVLVGGDHSGAIGSVSASSLYCLQNGMRMGLLWCDAHADFNTPSTSPTGNLHGMALSVLCRDCLPDLFFGAGVQYSQIMQVGVRDEDAEEAERCLAAGIGRLPSGAAYEVGKWAEGFEAVHISFDVDCLDPSVAPGVSTPVQGGMLIEEAEAIFEAVKSASKVVGVDWVELNPVTDSESRTTKASLSLLNTLLSPPI